MEINDTTLQIKLPQLMKLAIQKHAIKNDVSTSALVKALLLRFLAEQEPHRAWPRSWRESGRKSYNLSVNNNGKAEDHGQAASEQ